jgi:hypothetical protein
VLDTETVLQWIKKYGTQLVNAKIILGFPGAIPGIAIEKGSDGSFRSKKVRCSLKRMDCGTMH